jgi:hypothetical protein
MQKGHSSTYFYVGLGPLSCSHLELIWKCECYTEFVSRGTGDWPVARPPPTQNNKDPENNADTHL